MAFSTLIFLLIFLPISLMGYYLINDKLKNIFLLIVSIFFYIYGGLSALPVLLGSLLFNYFIALVIDRLCKSKTAKKIVMITAVTANVGLLFSFKYLSSLLSSANNLFGFEFPVPQWALPLGISFYTFSALSYVLDIYFGSSKSEKNLFNVALYITFFPKMISGPIVKWDDFQSQLSERKFSLDIFTNGVVRFIVGLGKKAIIADTIGVVVDYVFDNKAFSEISVLMAWFGVLAYLIQLYFDFSGYSDMAVGLGKMFGFNLDENFNYPYISRGIVEYWARWHITLGTWLKHYVYTPVFRYMSKKKNKDGKKKFSIKQSDYVALIVSWLIIGPWHGAGLKFIVYGIYYAAFIIGERIFDSYKKKREKSGKPLPMNFFTMRVLPHLYFFTVLIFGQMLFRADSLSDAVNYLGCMFGVNANNLITTLDINYFTQYILIFIIGVMLAFPWNHFISSKINVTRIRPVLECSEKLILLVILFLSMAFIAGSTYNAFIYFNF